MKLTKYLPCIFLFLLTLASSSCKKFIEVPAPLNQLDENNVFTDDETATAAILGIYSEMEFNSPIGIYLTLLPGLSADELTATSGDITFSEFTTDTYTADNPNIAAVWSIYANVYEANACIQGIQNSTTLDPATKNQLLGEALFSRAFCYFYLVNLFGDVPLVTATDYRINDTLSRTASSRVYQQIVTDLVTAQSLLSSSYPTTQRVRPNLWTATSLLSRVYLYTNQWTSAEAQASSIINSGLYTLSGLDSVFLNTSNETIWQLMPVNPYFNTQEAAYFIPGSASSIPTYPLTNDLVSAFEPGDNRLTAWTGTTTNGGQVFYYPYKYQNPGATPVTEDHILFRLAEQYLIRAEARMQLGNLTGAIADVNIIRSRAGLTLLPLSLTPAETATSIQQERRIELFAELGHRWLDLKRTGQVNLVIGTLKPSTWNSNAGLWPIPLDQLAANPSLTQNKGY
jgi:hypothetical protein